ncbi:MAG: hypothetical protein JRH08_13700 [Deltaproteobacteria bacterium]|nr:hypothetical protein [Deltaproteobacteria bacterium]MBW2126705.1 hypothetical protein [Deltaproteobacteria bacterium]
MPLCWTHYYEMREVRLRNEPMERKKVILFILLAIFAISVVYRVLHPYRQPRVSQLKYGQRGKGQSRIKVKVRVTKKGTPPSSIDMDLFLHPPKHSAVIVRDPFFLTQRKAMPIPKPTAQASFKSVAPPAVTEDPKQRVTRELSQFRVFGSFENNDQIALFLERGNEILVIRQGDWIDGRYQVKKITPDSITIWAEEIGEDIHIAFDQ